MTLHHHQLQSPCIRWDGCGWLPCQMLDMTIIIMVVVMLSNIIRMLIKLILIGHLYIPVIAGTKPHQLPTYRNCRINVGFTGYSASPVRL
jgi:hypothetical protein